MAYTTINKSSSFMNPKIYTGNGSTNNITGVGFQPDWVWTKCRSTVNSSRLIDAVRGVTKAIVSNSNGAEFTEANGLSAFGTDGYTLNGNLASMNTNSDTYVSWNWKANGQGSANTDGSINTTYTSVNTTAGFSICSYTGTGANATIGHGLGVAPKMIITKALGASNSWGVYHASLGNNKYLYLDATQAALSATAMWNDTTPTSSVFSVGTSGASNASGAMIAYCFADVQGYQSMGSFIHNGQSGGPAGPTKGGNFIYLGFRPTLILIKNTTSTADWLIQDIKRSPINVVDDCLFPNLNSAESANYNINFLSNGFKLSGSGPVLGNSGNKIIYYAVGQSLVGTNNIPNNAF